MRTLLTTAVAFLLTGAASAAPNLVTNGDFEAGNTGFTSDYTYFPADGWAPEIYTVGSNPIAWHPLWVSVGDHTTGAGQMFLANGATTLGQTVWQSGLINIASDTDYFFEAFVMSVCCNDLVPNPVN